MLDGLFCPDYPTDRAAFVAAVQAFAARSGRRLQLQGQPVDAGADLEVTVAELPAARPQRLYLLVTGIHGIEGYAGSAIARQLLATSLDRLDPLTTSILIVHALNPYGFANFARVNRENIDLNRNCQARSESLFSSSNPGFRSLTRLLVPRRPCRANPAERSRFYLQLVAALARFGQPTLRQASLSGQYVEPGAIFYGGKRVAPEIAFFQSLYETQVERHSEILLTDLHTGYGEPGQAYPLFGRVDAPELRSLNEIGVTDESGENKTYTVYGDLVGYCYKTAKRLQPGGTFNGCVIELGTHGLSVPQQMDDLYTVVCENQLRQHGARDAAGEQRVRGAFREMFYPSSAAWRDRAVRVGVRAVESLLESRRYFLRSNPGQRQQ
jgi:hypothetical protein